MDEAENSRQAHAVQAVRDASDAVERSEGELTAAMRRARSLGVPVAEIAAAARMSKPTMYRRIGRATPEK